MEDPRYLVYCGDACFRFPYGKLFRLSLIRKIFRKKLAKLKEEYGENRNAIRQEFFPGLTFKSGDGQLWKPKVLDDDVVLETVGGEDGIRESD